MTEHVPYDDFVDIYDAWCESAPVTLEIREFYVDLFTGAQEPAGPIVELGVGNGRITVAVAARGRTILGVDSSRGILDLCASRAEEAGVADRVHLIHADFRDFSLPEPASLIAIPFHSIGHLLTREDRLACMRHVHEQLAPGGRLVFDHFVFDPDHPESSSTPYLRAELSDRIIWTATRRDMERCVLHVLIWTDDLDTHGVVTERRYRHLDLAWLSPEESRELLLEAGFEVETVYGDFHRTPFDEGSDHQVWVGRRTA